MTNYPYLEGLNKPVRYNAPFIMRSEEWSTIEH